MPLPSKALVTVTFAWFKPIGNCKLNTAVVAVLVLLVFTKLAVPLTTELTGALAGKPAKLALISESKFKLTCAVAVLLPGLVSSVALLTWPLKVWVVTLPSGTL